MWILLIIAGFLAIPVGLWAWVTQPTARRNGATAGSASVEPARLQEHVRMLSVELSPRDAGHVENLARAARYIRGELESAGAVVSEQNYEAEGRSYMNVVASFGPETKERIVVGAHYDAAGPYPAADDNASGVAGLIELARLLGQKPPPMRVELVAYCLEEPPFFRSPYMGSIVHAGALRRQGVSVRVMFSLEMIGYFSDEEGSQRFPISSLKYIYPSRGNFITVVGDFRNGPTVRRIKQAMMSASPLPVRSINAPRSVPGIDFSDHMSYWENGYDAVMVTDTAFYRNRNYHTANDTYETLDYERMASVVKGVHAAVLEVAQ